MTIEELVDKYGFKKVSEDLNVYRLELDDDEFVEIYQISLKYAYVRHEFDYDVDIFKTYATKIDEYIHELIYGIEDDEF